MADERNQDGRAAEAGRADAPGLRSTPPGSPPQGSVPTGGAYAASGSSATTGAGVAAPVANHDAANDDEYIDEDRGPGIAGRVISGAIVLIAIVMVVVVLGALRANPRTDDAEVFANFIGIAPQVDGPITRMAVVDNQQVRQGDVLFEIDNRPYLYALQHAQSDQKALEGQIEDEQRSIRSQESATVAAAAGQTAARANVGRAEASVGEAKADVNNEQAALDRAKADYAYAVNNLHRIEPLLVKQFVTVDQVDQVRTGTETKRLAVEQASAQLELSKAHLASIIAALDQAQAMAGESTAQKLQSEHAVRTLDPLTAQRGGRDSAVSNAQYNYDNCTVRAPFDARVTDLTISQGHYAHTGQQVFTLIDTRAWWVVANFRETQLRHIRNGMAVDVYLMSDPNHRYAGVVESTGYGVVPDASTVGTLQPGLPDVQRTLSWVHLASRYPVRIRMKDDAPHEFRVGESAIAVIRGGAAH